MTPTSGSAEKRTGRGPSLYVQVLFAIALGVLVGVLRPPWGVALKPLGDGFVKLIKMLIAPVVFTTVTVGIAGMKDLRKTGRLGAKAILYFEVMTTLALLIGLSMAHLVRPGSGIHAHPANMDTSLLDKALSGARPHGLVEHLVTIIPSSFVGAFVEGDVLRSCCWAC